MFTTYYFILLLFALIIYGNIYNKYKLPYILITSLFYNSELHVNRFFNLIYNLSYPKSHISIGILEGDSKDNTSFLIESNIKRIKNMYHSILFIHKNVYSNIPNTVERYSYHLQKKRRSKLALLRNIVINSTLKNEDYVLCIDSDVSLYRNDILKLLLKVNKDIVVPACRHEKNNVIYDINVWVFTPEAKAYINKQNKDYLLQQPYSLKPIRFLKHIGILHEEYNTYGYLYTVRVDGIGGTMALIKSKVFHSGVVFPESLYKHCLETEGFGIMANDYNFSVAALPNVDIYHYN